MSRSTNHSDAMNVPPLSSYSAKERSKRQEVIRRLTDPDYILANYLDNYLVSANPIRDGFLPRGSDFRDFSIVEHRGSYHAFFIDVY